MEDDGIITFASAIDQLYHDVGFRRFFNDLLAAAPYPAFRWETPSVTIATADRPFECVLLDAPGLDREADASAFASQFAATSDGEQAIAFTNLGGDATLIVPRPIAESDVYCHIALFVRNAPISQQEALWSLVGETMQQRLNRRPAWLNTAGAGVPWLHVRIDDRPKYYGHAAYRQPPS